MCIRDRTYYPPPKFKILLYYPETETFVSSGIYERYAFDTYYTVDMNGMDIGSMEYNEGMSTSGRLNAYRSYHCLLYTSVFGLLCRSYLFGLFALLSLGPAVFYRVQAIKFKKQAKTEEW